MEEINNLHRAYIAQIFDDLTANYSRNQRDAANANVVGDAEPEASTIVADFSRRRNMAKKQVISNDLLVEMSRVFTPSTLFKAMEIIDDDGVVANTSGVRPSFKVRDSKNGVGVRVLRFTDYCECDDFMNEVVRRRRQPMCCHLLATRIAIAIGRA